MHHEGLRAQAPGTETTVLTQGGPVRKVWRRSDMQLSRGLRASVGTSCRSESAPGQLPASQHGWGKGHVCKMVGVEPGERQEACH